MSEAPDLEALRREVREWIPKNVPANWRERQTGDNVESFLECQREWLAKLVEAGYATPHWEHEWPGGGRSLAEQVVIFEEMARGNAPRMSLFFVSLYHAAMTLQECGTQAQKEKYLPGILKGEVWVQGFSEPGAGSDLASLKTRAVRDGDHYVVNGQKIWSTLGQFADHCLLLVRTDPDAKKQAGITFLLMDMKTPGIDVRPIKQITGDEEFAEMFLDNVRIPVENRVGEENAGWGVAQVTLSSERGLTLVELVERLYGSLWRLLEAATKGGATAETLDVEDRRRIVDVTAKVEALRAMVAEAMVRKAAGNEQLGDASILKLAYARILRDYADLGVRLQGIGSQYFEDYVLGAGYETSNWMFDFMNSYQWNIAGGSNEIQRNIVAERMLELPRG
jgi:alkylation response protein AidB-like acyl-CoA dehydrogenase